MNWLKLIGWRLDVNALKDIKKSIIIEAPHTSNWDFIIGIIAAKASNINFYFIIKKEWNIPVIGPLLANLGAIFIDRVNPSGVTSLIATKLKKMPNGHVIFTPEGTRSKVKKWKSGFYIIAKQAGIPISVAYVDYKEKKIGVDHTFIPSGNIKSDCKKLRDFYKTVTPKNSDNYDPNWII
tara:strand:+ start:3241 stop:3780 length:540 start_codon:yes stop_codon:yes gene_type:complete